MPNRDCNSQPTPNLSTAPFPRRLRVLVFTTVFPSPGLPLHGTFVLERIKHLTTLADIQVIAPVPWHRALRGKIPPGQITPGLTVRHPRFWYIPKVLFSFRAFFLFLSVVR